MYASGTEYRACGLCTDRWTDGSGTYLPYRYVAFPDISRIFGWLSLIHILINMAKNKVKVEYDVDMEKERRKKPVSYTHLIHRGTSLQDFDGDGCGYQQGYS